MSTYVQIVRINMATFTGVGLALVAVAAVVHGQVLLEYADVIALLALIGVALDFHAVKYHGTSVSASMMVWVFVSVSFPVTVTIATVTLARAIYSLLARRRLQDAMFDSAQMALAVTVCAAIYRASSSGSSRLLSLPSDYGALAAAAMGFFVTHLGLVILAAALSERKSAAAVWKQDYYHLPLYYLGVTAAGALMAALWEERMVLVPPVVLLGLLLRPLLTEPKLLEASRIEGKTGLYNASYFRKLLERELRRATRLKRPVAVIIVDIDDLKSLNDSHGHLSGDVVLRGFADILRASIREEDMASRFGGDEFALAVLGVNGEQAAGLAERIRRKMEEASFVVPGSPVPLRATVSLGVACYPRDGAEPDGLLRQADLALYSAKANGRNQVRLTPDGSPLA